MTRAASPLLCRPDLGAGYADEARLEVEEEDAVQRDGVLHALTERSEAGAEDVGRHGPWRAVVREVRKDVAKGARFGVICDVFCHVNGPMYRVLRKRVLLLLLLLTMVCVLVSYRWR